jgi:hypothetical protein
MYRAHLDIRSTHHPVFSRSITATCPSLLTNVARRGRSTVSSSSIVMSQPNLQIFRRFCCIPFSSQHGAKFSWYKMLMNDKCTGLRVYKFLLNDVPWCHRANQLYTTTDLTSYNHSMGQSVLQVYGLTAAMRKRFLC